MEALFDTAFQTSDVVDLELDFGLNEADINRLAIFRKKTFALMSRFIDEYNVHFIHNCGIFFYGVHTGDPHPVEKWRISYMTRHQHTGQLTKIECMIHFIIRPNDEIRVNTVTTQAHQFVWNPQLRQTLMSKEWNLIEDPIRSDFDSVAVEALCRIILEVKTARDLFNNRDYIYLLEKMRIDDAFVKMVLY